MMPYSAHAAFSVAPLVSAKAVAVYGWNDDGEHLLYEKKQHYLYPIASLTKLAAAKTVTELYGSKYTFTLPVSIAVGRNRIPAGAVIRRDDLLKAFLISSSNDAGGIFADTIGRQTFMDTLNNFLHTQKYTSTNFVNVTGLDPASPVLLPNRMTAHNVTRLLNDIYMDDPVLSTIISTKEVDIKDRKSKTIYTVRSSNEINYNDTYKDFIIASKTGRTNKAGENLAFVTDGYGEYDYITVVLLSSANRYKDGIAILNWLEVVKK